MTSRRQGQRMPDEEFRRLIDAAKDRHNLSDIIGRRTRLKPSGGREMVGLCPIHTERTPSFYVIDDKGFYHCFGCGAHGDHMTFLTKVDGLSFRAAFEALTGDTFPIVSEAERAQRKREAESETRRRIVAGRSVWHGAAPAAGTLAETYLRSRGITMPLPNTVRFGRLDYFDQETGEVIATNVPAAICALQNAAGDVVGVQRIYLSADGRRKFDVPKPKLSLGIIVGSAFRPGGHALGSGTTAVICEGPEDGLTLAQEQSHSVLVACGTSLMPRVELPAWIASVIVAGDNNAPGRTAVKNTEEALTALGIATRATFPKEGFKDWNDQLRGIRA